MDSHDVINSPVIETEALLDPLLQQRHLLGRAKFTAYAELVSILIRVHSTKIGVLPLKLCEDRICGGFFDSVLPLNLVAVTNNGDDQGNESGEHDELHVSIDPMNDPPGIAAW